MFVAIIALASLLALSACAANNSSNFTTAPMAIPTAAPMPTSDSFMEVAVARESQVWVEAESFSYSFDSSPVDETYMSSTTRTPRRIKIGHMSMESEDINYTVTRFEQYTENFGGWIQSRSMSTGSHGMHASADLTLRVPAARYDEFVLTVSEIGRVRSFNDSVIDATDEYFDSQARLDINRAEEARLLEFIENSSSLEDIILLESRLSEVRTNIELHESNIRRINRDVSYSTLHVHLTERGATAIRPVAANLGTRMGDGFSGSIHAVTSFLGNLVVFMAYISVPLVICVICALVGISVNKRRNKSKKKAQTT